MNCLDEPDVPPGSPIPGTLCGVISGVPARGDTGAARTIIGRMAGATL